MSPGAVPAGRPVPAAVLQARDSADAAGFAFSCTDGVGALLATLVASRPGGRCAESGSGYGVGTAWMATGLDAAATLVTVDHDPACTAAVRALLGDDRRVSVLDGDWRLLAEHAPFDVLFCDGGGKRDAVDDVVDLLAPGGVLVLDDFTPAATADAGWPPLFQGTPDMLRLAYLLHPSLVAVEVQTAPGMSAVVAARRP